MALAVELVASVEAFEGLKAEWNELVDDMDFPEIFYRWEWNFHFFRNCRTKDEPFIIVVREAPDGRVVAIAPLCLRRTRTWGVAAIVAEMMVAGLADYQNFLVRSGIHRGRVVATLLDFLSGHAGRWDVLDLQHLCSRDPTTFQIVQASQSRHDWTVRLHLLTPVATRDLRPGHAVEDTARLHRVHNRFKTLQQRGFEVHVACDDIAARWPAFRELHARVWPRSPLSHGDQRRFFDQLVTSEGMRGRLDLSFVTRDGRPVAAHFGFVDANKVSYYMPAMDRAFERDRPGAVLLYALVEHYSRTRTAFDFLRTLPDYKAWYTDVLQANFRVVIHRNASLPALAYGLFDITRRFLVELGLPRALLRRLKGERNHPPPAA